ncbi:hypothetical protein EAI_02703, partial [Harpegnathos saltator]
FSNVEYADMVYVYGYCDGGAPAAVEEYYRRFPMRRIPGQRVFSNVFNSLRENSTLPSTHITSERRVERNVQEEENVLQMVQRSPTIRTRKVSARTGVPRTRVWRILHDQHL